MAASTTSLIWLYGVVNGQQTKGTTEGNVRKGRSGNVKGK
jgi:hypothetical protein